EWVEDNKQTEAEKSTSWTAFKARRASWNLLHELAGSGPLPVEAADVAVTFQEYKALHELKQAYDRYQDERVTVVTTKEGKLALSVPGAVPTKEFPFVVVGDAKDQQEGEKRLREKDKGFPLRELNPEPDQQFRIGQGADAVTIKVTQNADELKKYRNEAA